MVKPADSAMRSSRSTKRQANCRARSVPMVVLPEPIKPARHNSGTRDCPRKGGVVVTRSRREQLVALQNANCTTVGGEFDFGQALSDRAKEPMSKLRCRAPDAMRIRFEVGRSPIVDRAHSGLRLQIKGIVTREADLDEALATLHGIEAGADEVAVEENIPRSGKQTHVGKCRLENLSATTDGFKIQFTGALRTDQRSFRGAD